MKSIVFDEKSLTPSKIVCIGRNYAQHIEELKNETPTQMVLFIKPNSAISNELIFPRHNTTCHYEAEVSFLIIGGEIVGVGFGLDLTLRDVQEELKVAKLPWERAKAFDNSAVFSKFLPIKQDDIQRVHVQLFINGELRQDGDYELMLNKPQEILDEAKKLFSFEDGDILMSGTPKGVGEFKIGDEFVGKILLDKKVLIEKKLIVK